MSSGGAQLWGQQAVTSLKGVGPALQGKLARLGIQSVQDLCFHLPLRYEDHTRLIAFAELEEHTSVLVEGCIADVTHHYGARSQLTIVLVDAAEQLLSLRFFHFHQAQIKSLHQGARLRCFGEVRRGFHGLEMVHPSYRMVSRDTPLADTLTPIYPSTQGLGQKRLQGLIDRALARLPEDAQLELLPAAICRQWQLGSLREALLRAHHPNVNADDKPSQRARYRLVIEELLAYHLSLKLLRKRHRHFTAPRLSLAAESRQAFLDHLGFDLTRAQQRVVQEITHDMGTCSPMLRLVQGDVGSGKTVVAALAALDALASGYQVAMVAPTELLAEQHWYNFKAWFAPLGMSMVWLSGSVKGKKHAQALAAIADDTAMVIGTHALMQEGVDFRHLGLVIIDEQHRFGVHQRLSLRNKGQMGQKMPHQLVLTATPIPRTLAMSVYADLDISVIDELPPGRKPVKTVVMNHAKRDLLIKRLHDLCAQGRQVYWVCTLIEPSEQLEAQAAEDMHQQLSAALPELTIDLVHGRMSGKDKQAAMQAFKQGQTHVLVATTVIEVGVDVANASVMIIDNAERLGLSQLHQLRGRVGRGNDASTCVLLYQPPLSKLARARLDVMRDSNDGFAIAEKDLALRGPGEVLGTRQTGEVSFRVADLERDAAVLPTVHRLAAELLKNHPEVATLLIKRWLGAATEYANA